MDDVRVRLDRYPRGMTPIRPSRPVYGWTWECSCPEPEHRVNGTKRETLSWVRSHLREAHGLRGEAALDAIR